MGRRWKRPSSLSFPASFAYFQRSSRLHPSTLSPMPATAPGPHQSPSHDVSAACSPLTSHSSLYFLSYASHLSLLTSHFRLPPGTFCRTLLFSFFGTVVMKMLVLGAGLQGCACAYDLLQNPAVTQVTLADLKPGKLPRFLAGGLEAAGWHGPPGRDRLRRGACGVRGAGRGDERDSVLLQRPMAKAAVEAAATSATSAATPRSCSSRRSSTTQAQEKNITVMPDCGLAPGMVNILAEYGIRQLDAVDSVKIFVGGLPQHPEPPLNYQIVYSLEGALDYYTTLSWVLRDGKRTQVDALSELRAGRVRLAGRHARGVSHRRRHLHDGVPLRGQDPDDGVQDAALSGPRRAHGDDSRAGAARHRAGRREGHEGRAARRVHRRGAARSCTSRRAAISSRCTCR